ncbi:unnamed protein product [Cuscuta campestris]|uniref:SHSP domain-containing protein n=1 Tax=Cuscuta campestris TaxID=132261 RepID=A0A484NPA4_9ASTE|nr:unnamed protein product [Cuscuta campestris]
MPQKVYEDFIPKSEVLGETDATAPTVINIYLSGFKKEELKVSLGQPAKPTKLRMTGEKPIGGGKKWVRFIKEFPISPDCDTDKISAKFEGGILSVTLPKKTASVQEPDETKENKESGQGQQAKGQTDTTNSSQQTTKGVDPLEHKPDHAQKPTHGSDDDQAVQETKNKKAEEPAAPQAKGKAGISEEEPKLEESKGQATTTEASAKIVPPEPERDQMTSGGDGNKRREEASSEAGRGGSTSDPPPPKPRESNKKAEEQEGGEPANQQVKGEAVREEVLKPEEPTSHAQQAKQPNEVNGAKSETTTDDNQKEEGDAKNAVKRKGYECTFTETKLRKRVKMLNLALVVLAGIGIGLYVKNMIRSYGGEAEE